MQVKCEVFSRFGSSVDFSSDEPLGGVEAPTVGADLCVRPSSPERSLFCGRTRRSAPTQATSARQFHSSSAVTPISVGTHGSCVRCIKGYSIVVLTGTDAAALSSDPMRPSPSKNTSTTRATTLSFRTFALVLEPYEPQPTLSDEPTSPSRTEAPPPETKLYGQR